MKEPGTPLPRHPAVYCPEQILIDRKVFSLPATRRILQRLPSVPWQIVEEIESYVSKVRSSRQPLLAGKRILYLTRHQGQVLKSCQGMCAQVSCCLYYVVDFACNCPLDCSYCLLQDYLNNPLIRIYTNTEEMLEELEAQLMRRPNRMLRVGTGELTDSLALDRYTDLSRELVALFARQPNAVLELKTKTTEIGNLIGLNHRGRTVISWSLNTPRMIAGEEAGASPLEERLQAARQCSDWGYPVGFHFDPLVWYPGWETEYQETVEKLFEVMGDGRIVWISLGAFRGPSGLLEMVRERFPNSQLPLGELVSGVDGKMRYFRPLRVELFRKMAGWIRAIRPRQTVYLCMESQRVWEQVFGYRATTSEVGRLLDSAI
jgi:spore photoproduct lyase